jgi:hypothetical protein
MTRTAPVIQTGTGNHTNVNSGASQTTTTTVLPKPANMVVGDLLVAAVTHQAGLSTGGNLTCADSGWIHLGPAPQVNNNARPIGIWVYPVTSDPASISNTNWKWTTTGLAGRYIIDCYRVTGVDLSSYMDVAATAWPTAFLNGPNPCVMPSITTNTENALIVYAIHSVSTQAQGNPVVSVQPPETTLLSQTDNLPSPLAGSSDSLLMWQEVKAVAGPTGTRTFNKASPTTEWNGYQVAFKGINTGPVPTPGLTVMGSGGAEIPTHVSVYNGATELELGTRPRVYDGPQTIAGFMAGNKPFTAHRGGSLNFPEETLYAYTQSHNRGLRGLEISLWKTSDGSWACSHDQSTLRTTGTDLDITVNTRATLAALNVNPVATDDQAQPSKPFAFLDQVMALYGTGGPVLFLEDKQGTNTTALLDYLDTFPNSKQRFVIKMYGPGGATAKATARARGYKIWNYYFAGTDMNSIIVGGVVGGNIESCDYVGLDKGLTDADFSLVVAYGKPVFAHIISTTAQRDRVLSLGAVGAMVSDIKAVVPGANVV